MARITVEDCLENVNNRFSLIHMASKRVRQIRKGSEPTINSKNRDIVIALREIAAGNVSEAEINEEENILEEKLDTLGEEESGEKSDEPLKEEKSEENILKGD